MTTKRAALTRFNPLKIAGALAILAVIMGYNFWIGRSSHSTAAESGISRAILKQ